MTTANNRRRLGERLTRGAALCLLALAAMLLHSREARAQWSAPDASGNISSTNSGNVGVGTGANAPASRLHVVAASQGDGIRIEGSTTGPKSPGLHLYDGATQRGAFGLAEFPSSYSESASTGDIVIRANTGKLLLQTGTALATMSLSDGNVGIGTTAPGSKLDVVQANGAAFRALSGGASSYVDIQLGRATAEGTLGVAAGAGHFATDASAGDLVLRTEDATKRLLMTNGPGATALAVAGGKVGIGTTAPTTALHVVGDITVTGNINAKYQDVAEWVPTTQKLSAGTVVILDVQHDNHVAASTAAYDTRVAGVVSERPGLALGEGGEGKALVATTGRVRVKVDATRAPIHIGDLIVTSDLSGVAMRSEPVSFGGVSMHRPGTIIGKALESLEKGTGEILVLLSLQ